MPETLTTEYVGRDPELTVAKHQLRDWIESQLETLKADGKIPSLSTRINDILKQRAEIPRAAGPENLFGSVGEVKMYLNSGLLIVTTGLGIICGYDESAYAYRATRGRWERVWQSEQNDYTEGKYSPQQIQSVHVWRSQYGEGRGTFFVMTLGYENWCSSSWHSVYYRVWKVDSLTAQPLLEKAEMAYLRTDTFLVGSIGQRTGRRNANVLEVFIEFTQASLDPAVHNREAVRHYLIEGDRVQRVDPVALGPRDFVDEWLTRPWVESAMWSAPDLKMWYEELRAEDHAGEFVFPTMHCRTPDLWQVALDSGFSKNDLQPEAQVFFLVRWRPPYHFTMLNIDRKAWPECAEADRQADECRTLFSHQEWRW